MSDLSIKVNIAGRIYPLTIKRNEEHAVRRAAKEIETNIKNLQDNYAVKDKQDLLAMTALQISTELSLKAEQANNETVDNELLSIQSFLEQEIK